MADSELRVKALELALQYSVAVPTHMMPTMNDITKRDIDRARMFFDFLRGKPPGDE